MKIKVAGILLSGVMMFASVAYAASNTQITVNGIEKSLNNPLVVTSESVKIGIRDLVTAMGGNVSWDSSLGKVSVELDGSHYLITPAEAEVTDETGATVERLSNPAVIQEGILYVPLNSVVDVFGKNLTIVNDKYTIADQASATGESFTTEDLLKLAMSNSEAYQQAVLNEKRGTITYDDAKEDLGNSGPYDTGVSAEEQARFTEYQSYYANGIALEVAKRNLETQKSKLENSILAYTETILAGEKQESYLKAKILIAEKALGQSELKFKMGLLSTSDIEKARIDLQNTNQALIQQQQNVAKAWEDMNHLVGKDLGARYGIQYVSAYKPFEGNLQEIYEAAIKNSPDIYGLQRQIELAQNAVKFYVFNQSGAAYSAKQIDVTLAKGDLEKAKKGYKDSVMAYLNGIRTLESTREQLTLQMKQAKIDAETVFKNYKVGLATELSYEQARLAVKALESSIYQTELSHSKSVREVNRLWTVSN